MYKSFSAFAILLLFIFTACNKEQAFSEQVIEELVDTWHKAAADADIEQYFGLMAADVTYIGTDPDERWTRDEFYQFCEPYFKKGTTWDFRAFDRKIYTSHNNKTIWFDELLTTWMGVCRGSGVIVEEDGKYKISHYHLSVTIKNESIKEFLKIKQE